MSKIDPRDIDGWQNREDKKRDKRLKKRKQMQENIIKQYFEKELRNCSEISLKSPEMEHYKH